MGQFARATALLALVVVTGLLFAGTAGATGSHVSHVSTATDACSTPSLQDVADSDFFWYWPCASFLHVETTPAGESLGYVRSTPYAIDCPHACTRPFAAGTTVVLTAYPSNGAYFTDWSGACAGQGNPCTVTVNGDTQVTANFGGRRVHTQELTGQGKRFAIGVGNFQHARRLMQFDFGGRRRIFVRCGHLQHISSRIGYA